MSPKISVVMPLKRPDPNYLKLAVESVLNQTFQDFELIIVEDPSDRSAKSTLATIADERVRHIINDTATSHPDQINRAIAEARADIVAHLDGDDICEPDRLEKELAFLTLHPEVGVIGSEIAIIDSDGTSRGLRRYPIEHEAIVASMRRFNPIAHSTAMYRKSAVIDGGGYQRWVYPAIDYDLWCRLAHAGVRFANLPEPLVRYRVHKGEIKVQRLRETIIASRRIKERYWRDDFHIADKLRILGERALLRLPQRLVLRLFRVTQYGKLPRG